MNKINIRNGQAADWDALAQVFHASVRTGALAYTEAQRAAWSPKMRAGADWSLRMTRQAVWVAAAAGSVGAKADGEAGSVGENVDEAPSTPIGFMTLEMNGYLDCAYILAKWQGTGVFRQLYAALEARAQAEGLTRIYTHASLHARPAFAAMGFDTVRPETVKMATGADGQDVWLPRFSMEKRV